MHGQSEPNGQTQATPHAAETLREVFAEQGEGGVENVMVQTPAYGVAGE